jgi:phage baseplate assembly protein W
LLGAVRGTITQITFYLVRLARLTLRPSPLALQLYSLTARALVALVTLYLIALQWQLVRQTYSQGDNMLATRADKYTQIQRQEYFSDFLNNFDSHPVNNTLAKISNENSVKQSIRNLILTNLGERLFQPTIGSNIRHSLFEPNDVITAENITNFVKSTINQNEKRAFLMSVQVYPNPDKNAFNVNVIFSLINNNTPIQLNVILKRVR